MPSITAMMEATLMSSTAGKPVLRATPKSKHNVEMSCPEIFDIRAYL